MPRVRKAFMTPLPAARDSARTTLIVRVTAGARHTQITGVRSDMLCVKIAAPPVDGRANAELIRFLASILHIPPQRIVLLSGASSRIKRLFLTGVSHETLKKMLSPTLL